MAAFFCIGRLYIRTLMRSRKKFSNVSRLMQQRYKSDTSTLYDVTEKGGIQNEKE